MLLNTFEKNIINIYRQDGAEWLKKLPALVQRWAKLWVLKDLKPYNNLSYNYVLSGYQNDILIVLKLGLDKPSLAKEAKALEVFADHGAVTVLAHDEGVLLLQRADPGISLKNNPDISPQAAIHIACSVIEKLHSAPLPQGNDFPHMQEWLTTIDKDWEIPTVYLEKARALKRQLLKKVTPSVLLHGDLHRENILSDENNWLVIDPKGVIGSPINEVWACVEDPTYDLKYIADHFHYSLDDAVSWYYVHLILAACWQVEDKLDPTLFLDLAKKALSMIRQ